MFLGIMAIKNINIVAFIVGVYSVRDHNDQFSEKNKKKTKQNVFHVLTDRVVLL